MVGFIGPWEALILLFVILLLFGSTRFAAAVKSLGRGAREFKKSVTGEHEQLQPSSTERQDDTA